MARKSAGTTTSSSTNAPGATAGGSTALTVAGAGATPWLTYRHPTYHQRAGHWEYALDHYTGDIVDPDKTQVKKYLLQRIQGESDLAFQERLLLADYSNHFAAVIDSMVGMLFAVEGNANRITDVAPDETDANPAGLEHLGLGDKDDPDTPFGRLWIDADGEGTGYSALYKQLAALICVCEYAWGLVDVGPTGQTRVRFVPPTCVVNWIESDGAYAEVLLREVVDTRTSLEQDPNDHGQEERFVRFTHTGWQRYTLGPKNETVLLGEGAYHYEDRDGNPMLPIFRVRLPLARPVGWLMAKKANVIFNKESERDWLLRVANFPRLNLWATSDGFDELLDKLKRGGNVLHNTFDQPAAHSYIAPSPDPAKIATEVLHRKVDEFYATAFRIYGDAAKTKTATEVRHDIAHGFGAFLQLLKAALDDAENQAFARIEQREYPDAREQWWVNRVERSEDFMPQNPEEVIDKAIERVFGSADGARAPVPLGFTASYALVRSIVQHQGLAVDEQQIAAALRARMIADAQKQMPDVEFPAEMRAEFVVASLHAAGVLDTPTPDDTDPDIDATLESSMRAEAIRLAHLDDEQKTLDVQRGMPAVPIFATELENEEQPGGGGEESATQAGQPNPPGQNMAAQHPAATDARPNVVGSITPAAHAPPAEPHATPAHVEAASASVTADVGKRLDELAASLAELATLVRQELAREPEPAAPAAPVAAPQPPAPPVILNMPGPDPVVGVRRAADGSYELVRASTPAAPPTE